MNSQHPSMYTINTYNHRVVDLKSFPPVFSKLNNIPVDEATKHETIYQVKMDKLPTTIKK